MRSACLPRHPAVAYLFLVRRCANSLIALLIVTGYGLVRPRATRLVLAWHLRNLAQWFSMSEKSGFRVNSEAMRQTNTGLRFWAYVTTVPSASGRLPGNGTRPSGHCDPKTERQCKRETVEECVRILARARVESTTNVKGPCGYAFNASFTRQTVDTPLPAIFAALWIECPPFNKRTIGLTIPKWTVTRHRMPFPMRPWGSGCSSAPGR